MEADNGKLTRRTYNIHSLRFTPKEIITELRNYYPNFRYKQALDIRNEISKSWPTSFNDKRARKDWGWNPKYSTIRSLVKKIIEDIN